MRGRVHQAVTLILPVVFAPPSRRSATFARCAGAMTASKPENRYDPQPGASVPAFLDSLRLYERLRKESDAAAEAEHEEDCAFRAKLKEALDTLLQAYNLYGPRGVIGSFNGGKDAAVVLHLQRAVLAHYCLQQLRDDDGLDTLKPSDVCSEVPTPVWPLRAVFFLSKDEYDEVLDFVERTRQDHGLDLETFECGWLEGLATLTAAARQNTTLGAGYSMSLAFVLGTRRGDPNGGEQQAFAPSSLDIAHLARFMRVNPIVRWSYADVWRFLRRYELPYCSLYDQGYTSLGRRHNTVPNPALKRPDGSYLPAWMLEDATMERAGRADKKSKE